MHGVIGNSSEQKSLNFKFNSLDGKQSKEEEEEEEEKEKKIEKDL